MENVLIVDDVNTNLIYLREILEDEGYGVMEAVNGVEAFVVLKNTKPDLILLDIMMPIMDGLEFCEEVKKNKDFEEIPIIIISAISEIDNKVKALKLGAVDYVTKPFQSDELLIRIKTHLSLREKEVKLGEANKELKKYKSNLEKLVEKRTNELETSNIELKNANELLEKQKQELENTLEKLNETHTRLIHSEKMASLGVLVAGVAHEINNPVNYVNSSMQGLKNNLQFLQGYSKLYGQISANDQKIINEIIEKENDISLEKLTEMLKKSADLIEVGIERTTRIVKSLKSFAREDDKTEVFDIKTNIENTLIILRAYYKDRIEIIKQFGKVPLIECHTGKINQVFLNLLVNAMQAITYEGTIWISTGLNDNKNVFIKIEDTGVGIKPDDLEHIFDTFYTTKSKQKGSGLGLSISKSIITEHKGELNVESEFGKGTCFTIILPFKQ